MSLPRAFARRPLGTITAALAALVSLISLVTLVAAGATMSRLPAQSAAPNSPSVASASPMFRGDAAHSGVYGGPGVPTLHGVKWKVHTAGQIYSSPAVADGVVYVGSTDNNLYALSLDSGATLWKFATKGRVTSSPAVAGGLVYVSSYDSKVYAVDAATGKQAWAFATGGERRFSAPHIHGVDPAAEVMPDPFDFYLSSPAVVGDRVFVGSGDGRVYALDAATGGVVWSFQTGGVVHSSPAVANGVVFIGSFDTYLYALDAASGQAIWKFKTGDDPQIHNQTGIQSSPVVAGDFVYIGCRDSRLYALNARTGAQAWVIDNKGSWVIGSPAVRAGRVYFTTSDSGLFHVADALTGVERVTLSLKWPMFSSPALAGDLVYIGSHEGKFFAIDPSAGNVVWTFQTDGSIRNGPRLTNADGTTKYEAAMFSNFYDDIVAGVQTLLSVGAVISSPVVAGNVVIFGSADGTVYAIN